MENKVSINNKGVESAGLTKDYKEAIAEYIWNAFDAKATNVSVHFNTNAIDTLNYISVSDNGEGINFETLNSTFGNFLDSVKSGTFQRSSYIHGNKGKGRFSFTAFAEKAEWHTIYKDADSQKLLEYDIVITRNNKHIFKDENKKISANLTTGTTVTFGDIFHLTAYSFLCDEFKDFIAKEFGWFLFLNKDLNYTLNVNEYLAQFDHLISDSEIKNLQIKDSDNGNYQFKVTYIRWAEKIGDKFYFYFLNSEKREIAKELTSFNNNAIGFYHSIYVESSFFNSFNPNNSEQSGNLFENTKGNPVYKTLMNKLQSLIKEKQKVFLRGDAADKLIYKYEQDGVLPKFRNNKYEQERRKDLIDVVKSIYCIEPKIFQGLNKEQQKINLGLINLLLDTEERNNVIELIGQIVNMTHEEREELTTLLKKTTITKISRTISLVESRYKIVELLKTLVFDLKLFTNERDHIQKIIEENYWLFGEQYHLVSANEGFEKLFFHYNNLLNEPAGKRKKVVSEEKNRRPDIFICRKHSVPDILDDQVEMEENIIVELKRPDVDIGKMQLRQIEDYLEVIKKEDQFNSQKRFWKFIVVSNRIDDFTKNQYEAFKNNGKRYLVKAITNYEIYALTWDDIFTTFDLRHKFLLDKLEFDKSALKEELRLKGIEFSKDEATAITNEILLTET
ncbi:MAG: ATP-binding protein [Chitinophagaceae bacterium]|nr:ATP-binding protein [Chitinophagaceae bacterium]